MFTRRGDRTLLGHLAWLPWSLCAWVMSFGWMTLLCVSAVPLRLIWPFERFQNIWPHPHMRYPVYFTFSRLSVEFDERFDRKRTNVFVQNHVSMMDANIGCGAIPVPLCGLENASHLSVPGYGWVLRMANAIPVRKGARRYVELSAAFKERASRGISILTFPEAHRTVDGNVRPFKRGVFRMARDAGLPIVPVAVRGAYRMLPKGSITCRPANVEVYIGPQVDTEGLTDGQLVALMDRMRTVIQAWIDRREKLGDLCLEPLPDLGRKNKHKKSVA